MLGAIRDKREDGRKTEIFYKNTFPMCYAQDHLRDHAAHTLLTDGWKDIYSVGTGIDRQMIETLYAEEDLKTTAGRRMTVRRTFLRLKVFRSRSRLTPSKKAPVSRGFTA